MKKETENTNCKKCYVSINCPFKDILNHCPYIQNFMPIEPVKSKEREKEDFAVRVTIICGIGMIVSLFIYWLLK